MMGLVFFIVYVAFIAGVYVSKSKVQALYCNTLCCLSCSIYLFMMGGYAGVIACIAAASGSLYQLYATKTFTAEYNQKRVLLYKCVGSVIFTLVGIIAVYQSPADLLLVAAIISCRGSEMLDSNHKVKLGYLLAEAMWFIYAANNNLLEMYIVHCIMICLGLFMLYINPKISCCYGHLQLKFSLRPIRLST
jgi:hypothetical protein